jgi:hypothetical protein
LPANLKPSLLRKTRSIWTGWNFTVTVWPWYRTGANVGRGWPTSYQGKSVWWNAAREDQATDRIHRIGQQRGVQVFKLVTTGTLEEKISAIIEKKKNLMETIVQEDDPNLLKTFTREELLELIS